MTAVTQSEKTTAEDAYATLEAVSRLLRVTPHANATFLPLCHLTIRAVLHPALAPFLCDPLLPLGGEYVSLDARAQGIAGFLRERPLTHTLLSDLPAADRALLALVAGPVEPEVPPAVPQALAGSIWGALHLSSTRAAAPCRIRAVCDTDAPFVPTWPWPAALRPVSNALNQSAQDALAAALAVLEQGDRLPPGLRPVPIYYDVCPAGDAEDWGDAQIGAAGGDSLGLPLALAFLSALLSASVSPNIGATGALGKRGDNPAEIFPVQWVQEKAHALASVWGNSAEKVFFVPAASPVSLMPFACPVSTVGVVSQTLFPPISPPSTEITTETGGVPAVLAAVVEADTCDSETLRAVSARVRRAVQASRGVLTTDDGEGGSEAETVCSAVFPDTATACAAALAAQQALSCHLWPGGAVPALQIGIDRGDSTGDTLSSVQRATQIAHSADAGQTLLSGDAHSTLTTIPHGARLASQGAHRLRDLLPPIALFQLSAPGFPDKFPPPRTLDAHPHNLPLVTDAPVGRVQATFAVVRLLQSGSVSLVTLTGAGGVGKTRLALEATARCSGNFPGGTWLVSVLAVETLEEVASVVAEALHLPADAPKQVVHALSRRPPTLLLFDSGETVSSGASAFIAQVLRAAPSVTLLLTARSPLRMPGEMIFPVAPLAPEACMRLFEQRARSHQPGFIIAGSDRVIVGEIGRLVGGLPLALELAAAQARVLLPAEIAARLSRAAGQNPRQAARSTLESLVPLLPSPEQRLLARLSVFAGGFTLNAAAALAPHSDQADTTDQLLALEDAALVRKRSAAEQEEQNRYFLLPSVHAFAARRLAAAPQEEKAAREAHARYFQKRAALLLGVDETGAETPFLDALAPDGENLRLAQSWLRDNNPAALPDFVQVLIPFLRSRNHRREENDWVLAALSAAESAGDAIPARVRAWLHFDRAAYCQEHAAPGGETEYHLLAAEQWAEKADFPVMQANVDMMRGIARTQAGDVQGARAALESARALHHQHGSTGGEASTLNNLAWLCLETNDRDAARRFYVEAAALCHQVQDKRGLSRALNSLGYLAGLEGELDQAHAHFLEVLQLAHETKDAFQIAVALLNLGDIEEQSGEVETAVPLLALAETIFARLGHSHFHEAGKYLNRTAGTFPPETLAALRSEWGRRPLPYLLRLDPRPILRNV